MPAQRRHLPPIATLTDDRSVLRALQTVADYAPHNPAYSTSALLQRETTFHDAEIDMERTRQAFEAARERLMAAAWSFHDDITGAKAAFVGQFGADSQIVHAIGFKKKSERRRPGRRQARASE